MSKIRIIRQEQVCPATGETFIPDRDNQVYKNRAVQIKHNNEQAKLKRMEIKELNDTITSNREKLYKLYLYMKKNNWEKIHAGFVDFQGVNLNIFSKAIKNRTTGGRICWNLDYGIEATDEDLTYFIIHKKQK
jgi:hypothetical protein